MRLRHRLHAITTRRPSTPAGPDLLQQFRALMDTRPPSTAGPDALRVGIASFGAGTPHAIVDCLLAHALQLRGAACALLVCDLPTLPGCDERLVEDPGHDRCAGCITPKRPFLEASGLDWVGLTTVLPDADDALASARRSVDDCADDELTTFRYDGWPVGEWLGSSVASFLRSDSHGMRPEVIEARRRYLVGGIVALQTAVRWLDDWRPDVVVVISGRHVFWRAVREVAASRGIKVVCREMFNEDFDYHIYAVNSSCEDPALPRAWAEAQRTPLTEEQESRVDTFLRGLPAFARQTDTDPVLETRESAIREQLGLDPARPLVALFTNVSWDLFVAERDYAFDGQMEWLAATLDYVRTHPEIDLVVRAHPAEIVPKFRTRGRIVQQISETFAPLPENLHLVGPESDISSDVLRGMAALNLVYCASVGLEATVAGQPLIVCGNPYYARKGFTVDVDSPEHYRRLLDDFVGGESPAPPAGSAELARRFLYLTRFRYGMQMGLTTRDVGALQLTVHDLAELAPGRSLALDTACDGILHHDEILLPA